MPTVPLMPLLAIAAIEVVAGLALIAAGNFVGPSAGGGASFWQRLAPLWGGVVAAEGVGQFMFWLWSEDNGYGQVASDAVLLAVLGVVVLPPLAYGVWRSRQLHHFAAGEQRTAVAGSPALAYTLAGAAITLALATIVLQWQLERISGGWHQVLFQDLGGRISEGDIGAQLLVHSFLRLVTIIRFGCALAVSIGVLALVLSVRQNASARRLASAGILLSAGAVWIHWAWLERLRWS